MNTGRSAGLTAALGVVAVCYAVTGAYLGGAESWWVGTGFLAATILLIGGLTAAAGRLRAARIDGRQHEATSAAAESHGSERAGRDPETPDPVPSPESQMEEAEFSAWLEAHCRPESPGRPEEGQIEFVKPSALRKLMFAEYNLPQGVHLRLRQGPSAKHRWESGDLEDWVLDTRRLWIPRRGTVMAPERLETQIEEPELTPLEAWHWGKPVARKHAAPRKLGVDAPTAKQRALRTPG